MADIRLKEIPFSYGGRDFRLRCNMNVLADVQESCGGDLLTVLQKGTVKSVLVFLSAMMNDYADEQGWPERYTPTQVGRSMDKFDKLLFEKVMKLVMLSVLTEETNNDSKN